MALFRSQRSRDVDALAYEVPSCESPAAKDRLQRGQLAAARRLGRYQDVVQLRNEINERRRPFRRPEID